MKRFNLLLVISLLFLTTCKESTQPSFVHWYEVNRINNEFNGAGEKQEFIFQSGTLTIDTIYRSMQGPYHQKEIKIDSDGKLIWLTAYEVNIIDADSEERIDDGFMCHNNLNITGKSDWPWEVKTSGSKLRIFTLAQGENKVKLPTGFGIPIPAGNKLECISQVLNHNYKDTNINVQHRVTITYVKDQDLAAPMIPLYQQAIFVTKPEETYHKIETVSQVDKEGKSTTKLCLPKFDKGNYNPLIDRFGNTYTGHWNLGTEPETLYTDVTNMLGLTKNTKAHYISVHIHPFARQFDFMDKTLDSIIFSSRAQPLDMGVGIRSIEHYSDIEGMLLHADHNYQLRSIYHCTDTLPGHTAMAVMYLYLEMQ